MWPLWPRHRRRLMRCCWQKILLHAGWRRWLQSAVQHLLWAAWCHPPQLLQSILQLWRTNHVANKAYVFNCQVDMLDSAPFSTGAVQGDLHLVALQQLCIPDAFRTQRPATQGPQLSSCRKTSVKFQTRHSSSGTRSMCKLCNSCQTMDPSSVRSD